MARSYRVTRGQRLRMVEIPAALPGILGGLRIGITAGRGGCGSSPSGPAGETGLGVLINLARGSLFDIPLMFAALLTIAIIGVALYSLVPARRAAIRDPASLTAGLGRSTGDGAP